MTDIKTSHHIKTSKLIEYLQEVLEEHGDVDVIMAKDPEGNGYSPFASMDIGWYIPDSTWSGEFGPDEYVKRYPDDYEHYPEEGVRVVCLGPVN